MEPTICLYNLSGLGLIISHPTGVFYNNQTGGLCCLQSHHEGILVPLDDELRRPEKQLLTYFTGPGFKYSIGGLDFEAADFIDAVLHESSVTECISVDRKRLSDSIEAWVHVLIDDELALASMWGFGKTTGVLTWPNSD